VCAKIKKKNSGAKGLNHWTKEFEGTMKAMEKGDINHENVQWITSCD
jgi:hypothetical protein